MKKQVCTVCGKNSIPGLKRGCGKCQYHWNVGAFGRDVADKAEADRRAKVEDTMVASYVSEGLGEF